MARHHPTKSRRTGCAAGPDDRAKRSICRCRSSVSSSIARPSVRFALVNAVLISTVAIAIRRMSMTERRRTACRRFGRVDAMETDQPFIAPAERPSTTKRRSSNTKITDGASAIRQIMSEPNGRNRNGQSARLDTNSDPQNYGAVGKTLLVTTR